MDYASTVTRTYAEHIIIVPTAMADETLTPKEKVEEIYDYIRGIENTDS